MSNNKNSHEGRHLNSPPIPPAYESASAASRNAGGDSSATAGAGAGGSLADDGEFICNVCLDPVKDPVVTQCGHLYCWPCLFRWLNINHTTCPVCKAGVSQENVIPIFLGGSSRDPRVTAEDGSTNFSGEVVPNRPQGQRPEPQGVVIGNNNGQAVPGISFTGNFGFFPSLFGLQFQEFVPTLVRNRDGAAPSAVELHEQFLYRVLIAMGSVVFLCFLAF